MNFEFISTCLIAIFTGFSTGILTAAYADEKKWALIIGMFLPLILYIIITYRYFSSINDLLLITAISHLIIFVFARLQK